MKKLFSYFLVLFTASALFSSCEKDDVIDPFPSKEIKGCYIVNYGKYDAAGASISRYNYETDEMTNAYFQAQNGGSKILSSVQFGYHYNDSIFFMGNSVDQLVTVNPFFKQSFNGVTNGIEKPRFCIADGDYLYVSCWGTNPDWGKMPDTYIAKYNIATRTVEEKISLPGGPEGLEMANGKLYAALNYKDSIAVLDIAAKTVSYITTPAVSSYFVKDKQDNLYVTLLSSYSNPSTETGLGFINTSTNELTTYPLAGVSDSYGSMIKANADFSKIYVVTSAYDANWIKSGAVSVFDVASKSFANENFVSDVSGILGVAVNPVNDDVYVFASTSSTTNGTMSVYTETGEFTTEHKVGINPNGAIFLN